MSITVLQYVASLGGVSHSSMGRGCVHGRRAGAEPFIGRTPTLRPRAGKGRQGPRTVGRHEEEPD